MSTPLHRLADTALQQPLAEFVAALRREGQSWYQVSTAIRDATKGEIDINPETLRGWFPDKVSRKAAS